MADALHNALCALAVYRLHCSIGLELQANLDAALRELAGQHGAPLSHLEPPPIVAPRQRQPRNRSDMELIAEGVRMVREGEARSANEAARVLATVYAGHSIDATRDRIGRAIREQLKSFSP